MPEVMEMMTRDEVFREMEDMFGEVPIAYREMPDKVLGLEWERWKRVMQQGLSVPKQYMSLIGLAVAAAVADDYDTSFFREMAKMEGASEEQIRDVAYYIRDIAGWGAFVRAAGADLHQYKAQMDRMMQRVRSSGTIQQQEDVEKTMM